MFDKQYSIMMPKRVVAGPESISSIVGTVQSYQAEKVLIITDKGVWNAGLVEKPLKILEDAGIKVEVINDVPTEPEIEQVEDLLKKCRKFQCDMVMGIGGGSSMDSAKLIAALINSDQCVRDILGEEKLTKKGLPTLMVPTTAGTGSEATPNSIVTIPEDGVKFGIVSRYFIADQVILDPMLTLKLPPKITASTGVDALAHAIECFISKKSNPFSDTYALAAIRLICSSIRKAYLIGDDAQARHNMLLGSFYGGMCIATSGTTAVHALAYPLGGRFKIPHGVSNAMLLPHVMEFNKDSIEDKLYRIAPEMDIDISNINMSQAADKVIEKLYFLVKDLGICPSLREYGIADEDLPFLVEEALKVKRLLGNNPKTVEKDDIYAIYQKLM